MQKHEVEIGGRYRAKVSGRVVTVRITGSHPYGGWNAVNTTTGRAVRIRTAGRLRGKALSDAQKRAVIASLARLAKGGSK